MNENRETAELLTVAVTARRLNVSKPTVYRLIAAGEIPALRIGNEKGPLRIPEDELSFWLEEHRTLDSSPAPGNVSVERRVPESSRPVEARQHGGEAA